MVRDLKEFRLGPCAAKIPVAISWYYQTSPLRVADVLVGVDRFLESKNGNIWNHV